MKKLTDSGGRQEWLEPLPTLHMWIQPTYTIASATPHFYYMMVFISMQVKLS